jgi:hypothetical protein
MSLTDNQQRFYDDVRANNTMAEVMDLMVGQADSSALNEYNLTQEEYSAVLEQIYDNW